MNFLLPRKRCSTLISRSPVHVVVDRLAIGSDMRSRLIDSVEICYREGRGEAILEFVPDAAGGESEAAGFHNERFECKTCGAVYQEPEPRLFSFNSPYGACPRCQGFGNTGRFRYQSGDSRPRKISERRRDPTVDDATLSRPAERAERNLHALKIFLWMFPSAILLRHSRIW